MSDTVRMGVVMIIGGALLGGVGVAVVAVTSPSVVVAMLIGEGSVLLGMVVGGLWDLRFGGRGRGGR